MFDLSRLDVVSSPSRGTTDQRRPPGAVAKIRLCSSQLALKTCLLAVRHSSSIHSAPRHGLPILLLVPAVDSSKHNSAESRVWPRGQFQQLLRATHQQTLRPYQGSPE